MRTKLIATMLALLFVGGCTQEQPASGPDLATEKGCVACHGLDGRGIAPTFPILQGQWEEYLRLQLMAYRSGTRKNAIMNVQAAGLTDVEIRALAAHYAGG